MGGASKLFCVAEGCGDVGADGIVNGAAGSDGVCEGVDCVFQSVRLITSCG